MARVKADVIAQHTRQGELIPLKIKISDEDGEEQTFAVKGYRRLNAGGTVMLPNEVNVLSHIRYFQCKIEVFGVSKIVDLSYNFNEEAWYMCYR